MFFSHWWSTFSSRQFATPSSSHMAVSKLHNFSHQSNISPLFFREFHSDIPISAFTQFNWVDSGDSETIGTSSDEFWSLWSLLLVSGDSEALGTSFDGFWRFWSFLLVFKDSETLKTSSDGFWRFRSFRTSSNRFWNFLKP